MTQPHRFSTILWTITVLLFGGCASFTPDQHIGDGVWMRGDDTTYEAPEPLQVVDASIISHRTETRNRTETQETENADGDKVIREKDIIELNMGVDIEIELEDGSVYNVYLTGTGRVNQQVSSQASFTASNGYIYSVNGTLYTSLDRPRVLLTITSKGPVRYQNTLLAN